MLFLYTIEYPVLKVSIQALYILPPRIIGIDYMEIKLKLNLKLIAPYYNHIDLLYDSSDYNG